MSYMVDGYYGETAANAPVSARVAFIRRTYAHLAVAVAAFVGVEAVLLASGIGENIVRQLFVQRFAWLVLMGLFVIGGHVATNMAFSARSVGTQYMGLAMYVLLEAVVFLPLMYLAIHSPQYAGKNLPLQAGIVTLLVFGGLTASVFLSGKDFSFMGPILSVCCLVSFGVVIVAVLFGFNLGLVFVGAMIALAAGCIIYQTSNIIHQYGTNQHVGASLALFASVATLFWYILQLFMSVRGDD